MSVQSPALYCGHVMHFRALGQRNHRFRYRMFRLWLDVDRIGETFDKLRAIRHKRFGLFSFFERDHGPRDGSPLRPWIEGLLAGEGVERPARIMLMCIPRVFGYEFNPLALYAAYDRDGALTGVVYQVRNTDGDLSPYVVNVAREGLCHERRKAFYVSPFIDGTQRYSFSLKQPAENFALKIRLDGPQGLTLVATENAKLRPLTDRALLWLAVTQPLLAMKVTAGIYFEALRLRLKGAPFFRYPGNNGLYKTDSEEETDLLKLRDTG